MPARPVAVTRHRAGLADVDLVQVIFTGMFTWMDIGFTEPMDLVDHPSSVRLRAADHGTVERPGPAADPAPVPVAPRVVRADEPAPNVTGGTGVDELVRAGVVDPRGHG